MNQRGTGMPYFKSLNRPFLILGVDRSLFFLLLGLCLPIAFSGHLALLMDGVAALCFLSAYSVGRLITRADPQMLTLYRRHIRYRKYYAAQPSIHAIENRVQFSVPVF